jgi:cell division topological specificity factor
MSLFSFFNRRTSAPVARERLQVLLAHERTIVGGESDLVAILREEILAVIAKHMSVPQDSVQIKMDRGASVSTLEVDIEIPTSITAGMRPAA